MLLYLLYEKARFSLFLHDFHPRCSVNTLSQATFLKPISLFIYLSFFSIQIAHTLALPLAFPRPASLHSATKPAWLLPSDLAGFHSLLQFHGRLFFAIVFTQMPKNAWGVGEIKAFYLLAPLSDNDFLLVNLGLINYRGVDSNCFFFREGVMEINPRMFIFCLDFGCKTSYICTYY